LCSFVAVLRNLVIFVYKVLTSDCEIMYITQLTGLYEPGGCPLPQDIIFGTPVLTY